MSMQGRHKTGQALMHAILALVAIYTLAPLVFLIFNSFKSNNEIVDSPVSAPSSWIHFPSKKACPKSSAAPFRQNRPLSFRNHRSEAPADSGYIHLKSDRIFQKLRSVQSGKDESNQRKQSSTHFLPRGSADAL